MLFLIPIVAGAAAWLNRDQPGSYSAGQGDRKIDCYQIWNQITHGAGPSSISNGQHAATRLKAAYSDRLAIIDQLCREMDAAWKGDGAAAAQDSGAHPLKVWMEDSGKKLADSDKFLGDQHSAFSTVAAKVQQVPPQPPQNNFLNSITPWETDTDRAIQEYNRNGQANVDAFNAYFKASNENAKGLPTYSAVEGAFEKVGVTDDNKNGNGKDRNGNGSNGDTGTGGYPPSGGPFRPGNIPGGGYPPSSVPGGGYTPPNIPGGGSQPSQVPGGGYTPPNVPGGESTRAAGYTPPNIPGTDFSGGGFGPGGSSAGGFGPGGSGAGGFGAGGGFGPGGLGTGGFGPGSSSGAATPGAGSGTGAGGAGAAGRAAMGKAGTNGTGGFGGMGAGGKGGKGGEDEERTSKYLVGDDPNALFGTDELTAPPVIGE